MSSDASGPPTAFAALSRLAGKKPGRPSGGRAVQAGMERNRRPSQCAKEAHPVGDSGTGRADHWGGALLPPAWERRMTSIEPRALGGVSCLLLSQAAGA